MFFLVVFVVGLIVIGLIPEKSISEELFKKYNKAFQLLSEISITIGVLGVLVSYLLKNDNEKQNQLNTSLNLMTKYSSVLPSIVRFQNGEITDETEQSIILMTYYTLSEEQLLYIGQEGISENISVVWINGIKDQLVRIYELEQENEDDDGEPDLGFVSDFLPNYPLVNVIWESYLDNNQINGAQMRQLIINKYRED